MSRVRCLAFLAVVALLFACAALDRGDPHAEDRERMVSSQIEARGIRDEELLAAMRAVPRHEFVPKDQQLSAHEDVWLPIAHGQHISAPYAVAVMTHLSEAGAGSRVLEIGTGSGYQAAVLEELGATVYSIEIIEPLAREAERTLRSLGYDRVELRVGDGYRGWPEAAPFDAVIVTAAAPRVPEPLLEQLAPNGRLVIPMGTTDENQELKLFVKTPAGVEEHTIAPAYFVPMTGKVREPARSR